MAEADVAGTLEDMPPLAGWPMLFIRSTKKTTHYKSSLRLTESLPKPLYLLAESLPNPP